MKKIVIALLCLTSVACHKSETESLEQSLYGNWELRLHFFGFGGSQSLPAGNGTLITFIKNKQYTATGQISGSGTYQVYPWTNSWGTQGNILELNGTKPYKFEAHLSNDTLRLDNYSTVSDSPVFFYKKL